VEGAELFVLKGAKRLLEANPRPAIVVEVNRQTVERFGYTVDDLLGFLESKGFRCFLVTDEINAIAIPIERSKEPCMAEALCVISQTGLDRA
ncbi:MAG: FkbM family methyltransferase, partial [Candidatus Fervidibacter sp.]|uniref:FkbM family methyltransferase n=1 Tax=Candidatus Fervidibacter sp. TaxID=3100871 RepID=UPI00404908AD